MDTRHAKSPCCGGTTRRFGGRRRQCTQCTRTWRIRKKRRGRKRVRVTADLARRYLCGEVTTIRTLARARGWNRDHAQHLVRHSLLRIIATQGTSWHEHIPKRGPLIAIADAIWYRIRGRKTTVYLILLRPVNGERAVVMPPVIRHEHEDRAGWDAAFATVTESLQKRMKAVVCDGGLGIVASVRHHGWLLQRCHFHLLANLQMYCGMKTPQARQLLTDVRTLITVTDAHVVERRRGRLERARTASHSRGIRRILAGLLTTFADFQTYLRHPELHLPTTSNAAESYISGLQQLKRRVRGFRTAEAMHRWWRAYTIIKPTIRCNGKSTKLLR